MVIGRKLLFLLYLTAYLLISVPCGKCVWLRRWRGAKNKNYFLRYRRPKTVDDLVKQWAPLVWLSPGEKFMPSNVEDFITNTYVADENNKRILPYLNRNISQYRSKNFSLNTYGSIEDLLKDPNSLLYGKNPSNNYVSIYALVKHCGPPARKTENEIYENGENLYFQINYWIFYPYNQGKEVCVLGKTPSINVFNTCIGSMKILGNHVGDWEHMSLSFVGKSVPEELYLAVHENGAYYKYYEEFKFFKFERAENEKSVNQVTTFPDILRTQADHPVVFSANGSHGLWSVPGNNQYYKIPKLTDLTGYGTPWKTWNDIKIYHLGIDTLPFWMNFRGKWGNPKRNCLLFKGICEYSDGPEGIIRPKQEFYCS